MTQRNSRSLRATKGSSNRVFGLVFAVFFAIIAFVPGIGAEYGRRLSLALSVVFAVLALGTPSVLSPLNRAWTKFGLLLHAIVSPIALAIIFFGVVTPTGILMRLFGKGSVRQCFDRSAQTYWIVRTPPGPTPESLKDQF